MDAVARDLSPAELRDINNVAQKGAAAGDRYAPGGMKPVGSSGISATEAKKNRVA